MYSANAIQPATPPAAPVPASAPPADKNTEKKSWFSFGKDEEPEEEKEELLKEDKDKEKAEEDAELNDFINTVKNMTGLWDIDPPDSNWLHMDRLDHNTGVREPMGKLSYRYDFNLLLPVLIVQCANLA